jgi:hypothetical protein
MTTPSSAAAFDALAVVVRDRGIDIAEDPARLRGMLNDVLATDARINRAAVDAVVLAAEIGVPRDLSSTPVADVPRLTGQLVSRGVAPDLADQTVRAWMVAAQGGRTATAPDPQPAPATPVAPASATVLPSTVLPAAAPPAGAAMPPPPPPPVGTVPTTSPSAPVAASTENPPDAEAPTAALPPVLVPPPPPGPPGENGERGVPRRALVLAIAAIVAVLAIVGAVLMMGGDGGDDEAEAPTTTGPPSTTSTTTLADVTLEVLAPASGTEATTRDIALSGRTEVGATVTVNGTAATVDATGAWTAAVTLPDAENTFSIVATTPTGATKTVQWIVKRDATAPGLEISSPADGTVSNNAVVRLRGTAEAGAAVQIDGVGAAPDPEVAGGWLSDVTINGEQQTFTVTATDPAGNVTSKAITLRFQPPTTPGPTGPRPTPRPPTTPNPGTGTTTTAAPAPTLVAVGDDAGTWNFQAGSIISFNVVGNDSGDWTDIEYGGLSGGYGTLSRLSGGFFQYTMRDAGNWTETFQYRLRNSSTGAVSNWATVTFRIVCSC